MKCKTAIFSYSAPLCLTGAREFCYILKYCINGINRGKSEDWFIVKNVQIDIICTKGYNLNIQNNNYYQNIL